MTKVNTPLDRARERYDKARGAIISQIKKAMFKGIKTLSQEMQREKDLVDFELDDWVKLHPNFPLSSLRKSEFGPHINWLSKSPTGQLAPVAYEFWSAHSSLYSAERQQLETWKK